MRMLSCADDFGAARRSSCSLSRGGRGRSRDAGSAPVRILIADDDVTSRLVLAGVLTKHGNDVVVTVDGDEAWEAMQRPDAPSWPSSIG